ncbi:MAG TPA: sigma-70 family RNA polymerase sigma factor [Planctomycetota bacterium]|nr:sigma-70 family RNA polymerase sigma factor [Planctomycetota bacterium]
MTGHDAERNRILVEAAAAGDAAAVDTLLAQHLPGLRAYVRLRAGPVLRARESASDLVQSVCRDVLENIGRFRYPGESAFKAWLFATAMRKIADRAEYWTAGKRDVGREVLALDASAGGSGADRELADVYRSVCTPSRVAMGREVMERLETAFEKLGEDHREVIVLARIVGLSRAEIAERMARTEASVRNLLSRALAELASHLADVDVQVPGPGGPGGPARA